MSRYFRCALLLGAASAALASVPAFAQDAAPAPASALASQPEATQPVIASDEEDAGEIVVTAQRRREHIEKVPLAVSALTGDSMRNFQAAGDDMLALSGRVPGFYAETTTGRIFPRYYIRGLGNIDFYLGASQPVSIIHDDVVLEHVVLKSNPVYDMAQVEVLRGPQGSLFGRNTTAGIVKVDTIRPSMDFSSRAQASWGSYNTLNIDAGVGGPLSDTVAIRVSGLVQHRDDWVDNVYVGPSADGTRSPQKKAMGGFDDINGRIQLLVEPSDRVSFLLSGHARSYEGTSTLFRRGALKRGSSSIAATPRDAVAYDEAQNNVQAYDTFGGSLRATFDFGGATLHSITAYEHTKGYSRGDTDGGAAAYFPVNGAANGYGQSQGNVRDLDQWSQELRLSSNGDGPLRWQIGGIYFDSRDVTDFYQRAYFLTTAQHNPNNWVRLRNINTSYAGFGQLSYEISPGLTLSGGARITRDERDTELLKTANSVTNGVTYKGRHHVKLADTQPSWDLSVLYEASPTMNLYARIARGFRGPTIQGRSAVFNSDFTTADSETNTSVEAGFKSRLFDDTLRLSASAFYYQVKDIQLNGNDSDGNGVLFNADKATGYGVEGEMSWRPSPNFTMNLSGSLLKTEIHDKRVYAQVCALNGFVVCTVEDPTIPRKTPFGDAVFAQIDGNPLPNAPKYNLALDAEARLPLADGSRFFVATDWTLQGYTQFVLYKSKEFVSKGDFEGGVKLGYRTADDRFEFALFGRNITNEKNLKGVIENYMAAVFNEPRVLGLSIAMKTR